MHNTPIVDRRGMRATSGTKEKYKKKRPGRPMGPDSNIREQIMDAGVILFADLGYAGTTLREIADDAQVTQALINYYFGSKHGLFSEIFLRYGRQISDQRLKYLHELEHTETLNVDSIVRAFLEPTLRLRGSGTGRAFIRLQARLHTEPPEISYELRDQAYTDSTNEFVRAFQKALPELTERETYWRVILMIGAYMYAFSDTHRLDELAPTVCDPDNSKEVLEEITAFVTSGLKAPSITASNGPGF